MFRWNLYVGETRTNISAETINPRRMCSTELQEILWKAWIPTMEVRAIKEKFASLLDAYEKEKVCRQSDQQKAPEVHLK